MMRSNFSRVFAFIAVTIFVTETAHAKVTTAEICSTTPNPKFCAFVLDSDPRSANATLPELAAITIDRANSTALRVTRLITTLLNNATSDPELRGLYQSCLENFDDAVSNLGDAKAAAGSDSPYDVNNYASAAFTDVDTCEEDFAAVPQQLKSANQRLKNIISIVLSISNRPWNV